MRPTTWQYVLATDWLPACWKWTWAIVSVGGATWAMNPPLHAFADPWFTATCVAVLILAYLVGWFASILPGWFIFGPILYSQGLENGGPFVPGDRVYIIAGKHRGKISPVYSAWQNETVRVELGECDKEQYTDIFAPHHLLRATDDEQSSGPNFPDSTGL